MKNLGGKLQKQLSFDYEHDLFFVTFSNRDLLKKFLPFLQNKIILESQSRKMYFGYELEFYLLTFKNVTVEDVITKIKKRCGDKIFDLKKEDGINQFEVVSQVFTSAVDLAENITFLKQQISQICQENHCFVYFYAKPFLHQPPSSLQFSFSFYNKAEENLLNKSRLFTYTAISALLKDLLSMNLFANPTTRCYERISDIDSITKFRNSPINVSWGLGGNRTVAIRIANIPEKQDRRLEYRLASPYADHYLVLCGLLSSILYGSQNVSKFYSTCPNPIYQNAFEGVIIKEHSLSMLPQNLKTADDIFRNGDLRAKLNLYCSQFVYENDIEISSAD